MSASGEGSDSAGESGGSGDRRGALPPKPVVISFDDGYRPQQLREEVAGSRAILRREYGVPVSDFCYPAGRFDATVVAAVRAAGYAAATTEIRGYASRAHPYELDRYEILGSGGVAGMVADLRSGAGK